MKKHPSLKSSLYAQYAFFAAVAPILLLLLSVVVAGATYQSIKKDREYRYSQQAEKVASVLTETIEYITNFSNFLGKAIAAKGKNDPASISSILQTNTRKEEIPQNIFTWTMFDFVNPEGYVVAASTTGVIPHAIKVDPAKRSWIKTAPKTPWKLFLDAPDIGMTSGEWVIPTGFGVTTKEGKFLGILSMGLNIRKLTRAIEKILPEGTSFLLLNPDYTVITASPYANKPADKLFLPTQFSDLQMAGDEGRLPETIHYQDMVYRYYRHASPYPYIILIGDNPFVLEQEFRDIVLPQVIQTLALGLFFLVLLYFFRRKIVNPILRLSEAARSLAKGHTDVIIPFMNSAEMNTLADALSQIKEYQKELSCTHKEMRQMNITLEQRVDERTRQLQESLTAKEEFLNNMSHEIRTPIACIQLQTDMLMEDWQELDERTKLGLIKDVQDGCLRLFNLLNNLLELAKSRAGKMTYLMETKDIFPVVESIITECKPLYQSKDLSLQLINEAKSTITTCDSTRIGQVIRNLLANAVKFTPEGNITIILSNRELRCEDGKKRPGVAISIIDEGFGIPPMELHSIFEAFIQSSKTKTGGGGTGLGLAICREIIAAHRGTIWAENKEIGSGAIFTFILPAVRNL